MIRILLRALTMIFCLAVALLFVWLDDWQKATFYVVIFAILNQD